MAILHDSEYKGKKSWVYKLIVALLVIGVPIQIFPYVWMLSNSLKTPLEVKEVPISFIPKVAQWSNIPQTLIKYHLWDYILNTFVYILLTILIQCTVSALAAYALSKLKVKGSRYILLFFLGTLMMSDNVLVIPLYISMTNVPLLHISLIDNPVSLILANSAWAWAVFMFKGFFDGIPFDLIESARIDGSSHMGVFSKILLPLSKPVIAVVTLNTFMAMYNGLIFPLTLLTKEKYWTIMEKLYVTSLSSSSTWNQLMAILGFATIPVLIFYILCQKYIVQGISMTGLKG